MPRPLHALAALCACLSVAHGAQADARKVLTHETLWMMKRVSAPVVSPDGHWVVYTVLEPSYEQDKEVSDLWLIDAEGRAAPRRLTSTKAPEKGVVWSPDSRSIAFATKREGDEVEQIYVLDIAGGGEAHRVSNVSTGAANPQWRPDGRALLFESLVWPGAADDEANRKIIAERKARKYNVRIYDQFPVRYWNQWLDERHPTVLVQALAEGAPAKDLLAGSALVKAPGFAGPYDETRATLAPLWSPDGREVIFTATTERDRSARAHVGYHVYRVGAEGGEPRPVTPASGEYQGTHFAPDGRALFFKYAPQDDEVYHLARLERLAWPAGGEPTVLAPELDREVAAYAVSPDSRTLYLLVPEAANENLYRLSATGGRPERLIAPGVGGYTSLVSAEHAARPHSDRYLRERRQPRRGRASRPRGTPAHQSDADQHRGGGGHRLESAGAFLVRLAQGPPHPQHDREAAGLRPAAALSAAGAHPRRRRQ